MTYSDGAEAGALYRQLLRRLHLRCKSTKLVADPPVAGNGDILSMRLDRYYRALMLLAMLLELVLLGLISWREFHAPVLGSDRPTAGRYVQFGIGPLILDTQTEKVCNSYAGEPQLPGGYPLCPGAGK